MNDDIIVEDLNIHFQKYNNSLVIKNVSTKFKKGEITAIIGESGSGKSILAMSILGLLPKEAVINGGIYFNNMNLIELNEKELRKIRGKKIALIPQNPLEALNPMLKIEKQLYESLKGKEKKYKMDKLLLKLGFLKPNLIRKKYPFELSGGMQQRIVSAFGLENSVEWILADEPTKGLDSFLREQVYDLFIKIKEEKNISMIIITHDISLAVKVADNLMVMSKGEILEEGNSMDIFKSPKHTYTKMLFDSLPSRN